MDNMYPPRGGDRDWPTEQIGSMAGQGHAEPRVPPRSDEPAGTGGPRRQLRQGVAVAAAVVLLCGGAVAGAALAFERGIVQSVSPAAVVVRAQDGTTWTWDLVSTTVVRLHARRAATSALSAGQHVFVGGPVIGPASDARLIVIRSSGRAATSS